jgi:hypothetical protein
MIPLSSSDRGRQQLLVKEKALTRARDALAAKRRRMPWLVVKKKYEFGGPKGKASLLDLFEEIPMKTGFNKALTLLALLMLAATGACSPSANGPSAAAPTPSGPSAGAPFLVIPDVFCLFPGEALLTIESDYDAEISGPYRVIEANGIPNHKVEQDYYNFAIEEQDYEFVIPASPAIPCSVDPSANPCAAGTPTPVTVCPTPFSTPPQRFGVALNGVVFDPEDVAIWVETEPNCPGGIPPFEDCIDNKAVTAATDCPPNKVRWQIDAGKTIDPSLMCCPEAALDMDGHIAHTQPGGMYHYHKLTACTVAAITGISVLLLDTRMTLVGWAFDGFPVYWKYGSLTKGGTPVEMQSQYVPNGPRITAWDASMPSLDKYPAGTFVNDYVFECTSTAYQALDECNGKECYSPELDRLTYCYFLTEKYPYIPRCLKGTPIER